MVTTGSRWALLLSSLFSLVSALLRRPAEPSAIEPVSTPDAPPAARVAVLRSQFTAGVRGSRAPPLVSA
ncbi:hypothetical protein [Actinoplanes sp. URMC 104]|uniref:hypothetical protein n=1 Tax=Actinoplanes sp. URMC 104 TaxID=3423409 RepID=UPI003F1988E1